MVKLKALTQREVQTLELIRDAEYYAEARSGQHMPPDFAAIFRGRLVENIHKEFEIEES